MEPKRVQQTEEPQQPGGPSLISEVEKALAAMLADRRERSLTQLKRSLSGIQIDRSLRNKLLTLLDDKELSYEEIQTLLIEELEPISESIHNKRVQTQIENLMELRGLTSFKITDDVEAELKRLGEGPDIEARIDKISQRGAELVPTQTRFVVLDRILDILLNQPIKQPSEQTQRKTAHGMVKIGRIALKESG